MSVATTTAAPTEATQPKSNFNFDVSSLTCASSNVT